MRNVRLGSCIAGASVAWPMLFAFTFMSLSSASGADISDLKSRAAGGDANAQVRMGIDYRDGKGVARDNAEALKWFHKGAEKGDAAALDNLGWMVEHGLGTAKDFRAAAKYYRAAANKGHAQAEWNLGPMYAETAWGSLRQRRSGRWYSPGRRAWACRSAVSARPGVSPRHGRAVQRRDGLPMVPPRRRTT